MSFNPYSQKDCWSHNQLVEALERYTVLSEKEKEDFDFLWKIKLACEKNVGAIIMPSKK